MRGGLILIGIICFCYIPSIVWAWKGRVSCFNPRFRHCYGILHACPANCPRLCKVDCKLCKPYCACERLGAACHPGFIAGDGIMFYFYGKKDKDFCLVSDSDFHINAHFIGKQSKDGRDLTWVQSIGILFGSRKLHIGAKKVSQWQESVDNMFIESDGIQITLPAGEGETLWSPATGLVIQRQAETNSVKVTVDGLFEIAVRVVPITSEESRVDGYEVTEDDCFAHLELNFKFHSLSKRVDGVLGQTYRRGYQSQVKMDPTMPIMEGDDKFASSHILATDCEVSKFVTRPNVAEDREQLNVEQGSGLWWGMDCVQKVRWSLSEGLDSPSEQENHLQMAF